MLFSEIGLLAYMLFVKGVRFEHVTRWYVYERANLDKTGTFQVFVVTSIFDASLAGTIAMISF